MERVSFHRLARRELNEAAEFYELANPGLGTTFLDEGDVADLLALAGLLPESDPLWDELL